MSFDYIQAENNLSECLIRLETAVRALGYSEALSQQLEESRKLLAGRQYNVAVMGEFNRGKSSLINALLGGRILPEAVVPTTATVNRVTYGMGEKTRAVVQYRDGRSEHIPVEELKDYVTKLTHRQEEISRTVREVTVYTPSVICQNHVDLIDTPGLNENERMTDITMELVRDADAAIIPIHARAPFSETERNFLVQLVNTANVRHVLFVVTFMDQLDEEDYEYGEYMAYIRGRILKETEGALRKGPDADRMISRFHRMVGELAITGISAQQALNAFVTGDQKLLKKSRFEEFRTRLLQTLTAQQAEHAVCSALDTLDRVIGQMGIQREARTAEMEAGLTSLESTEEHLRQEQERYLTGPVREMLSAAAAKIENHCGMLLTLRPAIRKSFIFQLSSVRRNTNAEIRGALARAARDTVSLLDTQHQQIIAKLIPSLDEEFGILEEGERQRNRERGDDGLPARMYFEQDRTRLRKRASWILTDLRVPEGWAKECSRLRNLASASVNPMDLVSRDLDALFNWYLREIGTREKQLLQEWYDMIRENEELRSEEDRVWLEQKREELRLQIRIRQNNEAFYQGEIRSVQENCLRIRREMEGDFPGGN